MKYNLIRSSDAAIVGEVSIPIWKRITSNLKANIENRETEKYNSNPNNKKDSHVFLQTKTQNLRDFEEIEKQNKEDFLIACKLPQIFSLEGNERFKSLANILEWEIEDVIWFEGQIRRVDNDRD